MSDHYYEARYGELVQELYGHLPVVFDKSIADYQGNVSVIFKDGDKYHFVKYSYGSCSGCDDWEARELSDDAIKKEIQSDCTLTFNDREKAQQYIDGVNKYNDFFGVKL